MSKLSRLRTIREIVTAQPIASQDELRRHLARRGHRVTQATLSRDVHELGLVKSGEGYFFPSGGEGVPDAWLPSVERLIREFVHDVKSAQNLVVLRTSAGSAQPVAAAIDAEEWDEVVGTVGGDDTILVIAPDNATAAKLVAKIKELLA
jgi:transcriptional regulator of arginine metabolism